MSGLSGHPEIRCECVHPDAVECLAQRFPYGHRAFRRWEEAREESRLAGGCLCICHDSASDKAKGESSAASPFQTD